MARLHGYLKLEEVVDVQGRTTMRDCRPVWRLLEALEWVIDGANGRDVLVVPIGFETDLASVPCIVRGLIPASGQWQRAAVIHDYLYSVKGIWQGVRWCATCTTEPWQSRNPPVWSYSRGRCDDIFLQAMTAAGVPWLTRHAMWLAVRAFGWTGW